MHIKVLLENNSLKKQSSFKPSSGSLLRVSLGISQEFQIEGKAGAGKSFRIEKSPKLES